MKDNKYTESELMEIRKLIELFIFSYKKIMKYFYPSIFKIHLEVEDFMNELDHDKLYIDIRVILCIKYDEKYWSRPEKRSLGTDVTLFWTQLFLILPNNKALKGKKFYPHLIINDKELCSQDDD